MRHKPKFMIYFDMLCTLNKSKCYKSFKPTFVYQTDLTSPYHPKHFRYNPCNRLTTAKHDVKILFCFSNDVIFFFLTHHNVTRLLPNNN